MGDAFSFLADPIDITGSRAAGEATKANIEASREAQAELRRQFDIGQERLEPFFQEAVPAFQLQAALSGAQGPEAQAQAFADFEEDPGTAFLREQGLRLIDTGAAATGGLGGGDRLKALTEFSQGLALQDLSGRFNRLGVVSGQGQTAGAQSSVLGQQFATNIGGVLGQQAAATTQGLQAQTEGRQQLASTGLAIGAAFLSDVNMKTDIQDISFKECFDLVISTPLKVWRYLDELGLDPDFHLGPMAQDAPQCIKVDGKEMLNLHDELWLIGGALKHLAEVGND